MNRSQSFEFFINLNSVEDLLDYWNKFKLPEYPNDSLEIS